MVRDVGLSWTTSFLTAELQSMLPHMVFVGANIGKLVWANIVSKQPLHFSSKHHFFPCCKMAHLYCSAGSAQCCYVMLSRNFVPGSFSSLLLPFFGACDAFPLRQCASGHPMKHCSKRIRGELQLDGVSNVRLVANNRDLVTLKGELHAACNSAPLSKFN